MRRLAFIRPRDRGAIASIVAILFMGGVLLALAALTIDVGSINAERRTLQNGADAAAMSVARTCVGTKTCPGYGNTALVALVNSNDAKDHHTKIARVDGKAAVCGVLKSDANLPACRAPQARPVRLSHPAKASGPVHPGIHTDAELGE